ncbi:MAG: hypothetical protein E5Y10_22240 [Mesorhizobium sp.]|uniref:hypothetical protein n=1 Tax=Mesorhizobium sp. TaxID=1871066 RepID=UPI0012207F8F|nr:hypothetical protein [Mesorhizobium sp.]TIN36850.1 MAG: hypothetical protein E5Y13_22850 [Mesorhizobium sp.]TJU81358.1 MAG: hypothetical protein E5Y15_21230 [Mesorhizobium sp.]TJU86695.1 MAG: hypothetical protein E5Y10_22240 [Mesorhizobium sp.]
MKYWSALLAVPIAVTATAASAETAIDQKRKLYALGKAGAEYCPQITTAWFALGSIGYDMNADDGEYQRFATEKQKWFDIFRAAGRRDGVCELLMQKYGPGGDFEMFKYR